MLDMLEQKGHTNIVVFNDHPDQRLTGKRIEYACKFLELFVYFHASAPALTIQAIPLLKEIIDRHGPDVCHIHNFQNPYITEFLLKEIPCVRSVHDPRLYCFTNWRLLPDRSICKYPLGAECLRQGCLSAGLQPKTDFDRNASWILKHHNLHKEMPGLILESRMQIDCMIQNGFSPKQLFWLPNATSIQPMGEVREFVAKHHDPAERIVLFVGRASYEKGIHVLVESCRYLRSSCKIVIITAGPLLDEIKKQAAEFDDRIVVIPGLPYEETRAYYARASVVVVPSVWLENFCLIGLESFANMKPVIGSRIGGIQDWMKDGETGWFFEPGNAKDLAAKIDKAFENEERLLEMGENAYRRVQTYYNQDLYTYRLLEIYSKGIEYFNAGRSM
jgi:glycosyltransferase involved in cell wall biosynthesis